MEGAGGRHLDVAAKAASYNVLLQVMLRVSSFVLNGFILRFIQAELLGVVNLRLTLLYNSILFLSREALRKACLSQTAAEKKWCHVFNLLWCSVPLGLLFSLFLSVIWLSPWVEQPGVSGDPVAVGVFSLAAVLELLAEPWWVLGQVRHYVTLKVVAEGLPQLLRCVLAAVGVLLVPHWGLAIFCGAQLTYSLGYVLIYYGYFMHQLRSHDKSEDGHTLPIETTWTILVPKPDKAGSWFNPYLTQLSWSFFKQSFLKQLLTDGERYVMTIFGVLSFAEQGVYDVINNLGSLVARFIFLPIEESFYVFFAATLYRGEPVSGQKKELVPLVAETLAMLLKLVLLVALTILSFGYAYSALALDLYGGRLLSGGSGPSLLRWFCLYVLLLAVNGVTECFVFAAMSHAQVERYNRTMLFFSLIFLSSSLLLTRLFGSIGFVLANCINMATRITHSCLFIRMFFSPTPHSPLREAIPSLPMWLAFAGAFLVTSLSEAMLCCDSGWLFRLLHMAVGAVCLCAVVLVTVLVEDKLCQFLVDRLPTRISKTVTRLSTVLRRLVRLPVDHAHPD